MKNKIEDLRDHLFAALEGLSDDEKPMAIDRAEAIALVAQTIINSAKAETEFLRVTLQDPSTSFIQGSKISKLRQNNDAISF